MVNLLIALSFILLPQENDLLWWKVKEKYKKVNNIQGVFRQRVCSEEAGFCEEFQGRFYAAKPNKLRIEVLKPENQLIIADRETLFVSIKEKTTKRPLSETPPFLLFFELLKDSFAIKSQPKDKDVINLILTPIDTAYYSITLAVNRKNLLIEEIAFEDWKGNRTELFFAKLAINKRLPREIFRFK